MSVVGWPKAVVSGRIRRVVSAASQLDVWMLHDWFSYPVHMMHLVFMSLHTRSGLLGRANLYLDSTGTYATIVEMTLKYSRHS